MSEEKRNFLIVIDLSSFFYDHRRLARILVKRHIKTIQDLQNRITEIFGIDAFYLSTGGHFLPASEDIKILNIGETVYVTPIKSNAEAHSKLNTSLSSQINDSGKRPRKTILDDIPEEYINSPSNSKKRSKKHHLNEYNSSNNDSEGEHSKKLKVKHDRKIDENDLKTAKRVSSINLTSGKRNPEGSSETQSCHSSTKKDYQVEKRSTANEVLKIKKKLKQKTNEYSEKYPDVTPVKSPVEMSDFKGILPKLQNHIKNFKIVGRSNLADTVRLSRHVDTPMKTYTKRILPQRITDQYLAKNKVNIVKIDVIKQNSIESISTPNKFQSGIQNVNSTENSIESSITSNRFQNNIQNVNSTENPIESSTTPNRFQNSIRNINSTEKVKDPNSPPENYVKTVISSFEKKISPTKKLNEITNASIKEDQKEASNYTKIYLDQKDEDKFIPENKSEMRRICSIPSASSSTSFITAAHETTFENQQPNHLEEESAAISISQNISSIQLDSSIPVNTSCNSVLNSTNISVESNNGNPSEATKIISNKRYAGIGSLIEHLRESDSVFSPESDTSSQYVTKRKRTRKRRKKNKKTEESEPILFKNPAPKSIPKDCPNIHIKFDSDDFNPTEQKIESITDDTLETPKKQEYGMENNNQSNTEKSSEMASVTEMVVLSDENEEPILEIKSIFGNDNIANAPLMANKIAPKLGDIIAFKILKMTESYTPQISTYIIGKVGMYESDTRTVYFKILSGKEELSPVIGKLTSNLVENEENSNSKYAWSEFKWNEILEPKLLYP